MPDVLLPSVDLDLRLVRYFTVVAEHGNFGRAAAALHLAQPSLSRQIQRLEAQLGARLLDRTPQGSHLTAAGEVFLVRARALLRAARQATTETRAAAGPGAVTIGFTGNLIITPAVLALRSDQPDVDVHTKHLQWNTVHEALLDRRVDVAVSRGPLATDGLDVTVLREEPRVLVVPRFHRLAGRASVCLVDFADEPLVRSLDPEWDAFWRVDPRPDGSPAPDGPQVGSLEDKFELIAGGQAVAIVADGGQGGLRPDLTTVPIIDIEPSRVVLAMRAGETSRVVAAFCTAARTHLVAHPAVRQAS